MHSAVIFNSKLDYLLPEATLLTACNGLKVYQNERNTFKKIHKLWSDPIPTLISSSNLSLGLNMILSSLVLWHWKQQNLDTCCSLLITAFMGSEKRAPQFRVQSFKMLFLVGLSSFTFSKLLWIILISRSNCRRAQSRG